MNTEFCNAAEWLLDRRVRAGDGVRTAVDAVSGPVSYADLAERVGAAAAGLLAAGLRPEERLVLVSSDRLEWLTVFLAALRIGAVPVPVSTMYTAGELAALLADARPRIALASPEFEPIVVAAIRTAGRAITLIRLPALTPVVRDDLPHDSANPDKSGADPVAAADTRQDSANPDKSGADPVAAADTPILDWVDLLAAGGGTDPGPHDTVADSPAFWLYTSGTTGAPKAAMHRHGAVARVAQCYGAEVLAVRPEDRCFSVARLFFAYGLGNAAFFPLSVGATTILDPARPTPESVTRVLTTHQPTLFFGVPTFYAALLAAQVPVEAFASVRLAVSAGEPLPAELYRRFTARYGVELIDGIGSTEALHIFLSNRPGQVRPGTTGRPVPGYQVRLVDDRDAPVPVGTPGHLQIRGESLMTGYWCRTAATRAAFAGEWLRTGDTYVVDTEGFHTCLGRSNDMIKAGGIWVSPAEVEAALLTDPSVAAAAVVAVPDADGLDKPVACVVPAPGAVIDPEALIAACRAALAGFKRPRHVLVLDALPMTATGKIRRFQVREQAIALLAAAAGAPDA